MSYRFAYKIPLNFAKKLLLLSYSVRKNIRNIRNFEYTKFRTHNPQYSSLNVVQYTRTLSPYPSFFTTVSIFYPYLASSPSLHILCLPSPSLSPYSLSPYLTGPCFYMTCQSNVQALEKSRDYVPVSIRCTWSSTPLSPCPFQCWEWFSISLIASNCVPALRVPVYNVTKKSKE